MKKTDIKLIGEAYNSMNNNPDEQIMEIIENFDKTIYTQIIEEFDHALIRLTQNGMDKDEASALLHETISAMNFD